MSRTTLWVLLFLSLNCTFLWAAPERIKLYVGESKVLEVEGPKKMALGNKDVADVSLLSANEVLLNAKAPGQTSLIIWGRDGELPPYEVEVLASDLKKTMVEVDVEVLELMNNDDWDLGIDYATLAAGNTSPQPGQVASPMQATEQSNPPLLAFGTFSRGPISLLVDAMVQKNKAKLLAKPRLLTVSGGSASFLSGGEIPVVNQDSQGRTNTEYKNYGCNLDILPVADNEGNINTTLRAEVSTLDSANAVKIANGGLIPALKTRWVKTTIYVKKNGTIVIAGLIQEEDGKVTRGLPLISDIPLLGELFKTTQIDNKRTELVMFVTPKVVN